jgi:2',3'-cyclic-nucleotide 2'-phosphodiesterase (5'-nucleotidase family)
MPSPTKTVRIPSDLLQVATLRAQALGYPDFSAYALGLIRYDAMVLGPHSVTQPYSKLSKQEQDAIDARLLGNLKEGRTERGQYLKKMLGK